MVKGISGVVTMHYEKVDEAVEVIVHFSLRGVVPLRFLWRGRAHRVEAVRGRWVTSEGQRRSLHYAVTAQGVGPCELRLDVDRMQWTLREVAIDG